MYSASDVAKLIINWCNDHKISITNLKLQKLLYFIQGDFISKQNMRLIKDDFYAWQLGPVIPSVYSKYAIYSSTHIPKITNFSLNISDNDYNTINQTLQKYANKSTWNLVNITHEQDPWKYNYQIFGNKSIIPYADIERYFKKEYES